MLLEIKWFFITLTLSLYSLLTPGYLSIGFAEQPLSFLPHEAKLDSEKAVSELLFKKLFKYENDVLVPELIESYNVSDDKLVYTLKLKNNIYWQDGTEITSSDILYTLSLYEDLVSNMEIERISTREVKITLNTPIAILPNILTIALEPAHLQDQNKLKPVGSTSFVVVRVTRERSNIEGVTLLSLQDNKPFNKVMIRFYKNEKDLKTAYKLGEIDGFYSESPSDGEGLEEKSVQFLGRYYALIFNTKKSPVNEINIRRVLASNLNVPELLASRNFYINSLIAEGPISRSLYTKESFKTFNYKPLKFSPSEQKLVSELNVILPDNSEGRQIETFLKESWEKNLNVKLSIQYKSIEEIVSGSNLDEADVIFVGHEVTPDPDRYGFWHSTQSAGSGLNIGKFEDLRSDKALEEGRNSNVFDERLKHYNIFQDVIETKYPAVFLYHPGRYFYISKSKATKFSLPEKIYYPWDIFKNL